MTVVALDPITGNAGANGPDPRKILESVMTMREELMKLTPPNLVHVDVPLSDKPIGIAHFTDVHLGNLGTDYATLDRHVDLVNATEGMFTYLGEDLIDNFVMSKLLGASIQAIAPIKAQWLLARHYAERFGSKLLAAGSGNHEAWTERLTQIDGTLVAFAKLPVVYIGGGGCVEYHVGDQVYTGLYKHITRFNSAFNLTHTVKRLYEFADRQFDFGVVAHLHQPTHEPFMRHGLWRLAVRPGTYKTYDDYAKRFGFFGSAIGTSVLILFPDRREMLCVDNLETGVEILNALRAGTIDKALPSGYSIEGF